MSLPLAALMTRALELVRSGRLIKATVAIQAALSPTHADAKAPNDGDVIDGAAREVRDVLPRLPMPPPLPMPMPMPASIPSSTAITARFIGGSHTEPAGTRRYKLFVPPSDTLQSMPLIVMLHGCTQNADDFARGTQMNEAAARDGRYVLYPEQAQGKNPSRCWNWFKHNHQQRDRGEPAILAGMVRAIIARYPIDPRRVYVAGLSAGGAMAAILGETYPDLFAAVGVHSGLPTGAARDLSSALAAMQGQGPPAAGAAAHRPPTIVFHGDQDRTVHPANGQRIAAAHPATVTTMVNAIGKVHGHDATQTVQRRADGVVIAEHWEVHGAGHAWSGGSPAGTFTDPNGPDATAQMIRFFGEHQLRPIQ